MTEQEHLDMDACTAFFTSNSVEQPKPMSLDELAELVRDLPETPEWVGWRRIDNPLLPPDRVTLASPDSRRVVVINTRTNRFTEIDLRIKTGNE